MRNCNQVFTQVWIFQDEAVLLLIFRYFYSDAVVMSEKALVLRTCKPSFLKKEKYDVWDLLSNISADQ